MENCKFHKDKEALTRCKVCGAPLCKTCEDVHQKYHACPKCVKNQLAFELGNYKRGLKYIYMALICLLADFALFITEIIISKSITNVYLIVSIVFFVLFAPFCIWLAVSRAIKIKKLTELIKLTEREDVSKNSEDKKIAENFEKKQRKKSKKC